MTRPASHRLAAACRAVLVLAVLLLLGSGGRSAHAAEKDAWYQSWITEATLLPNGDLQVTEHLTATFQGGPFTIGEREFDDDWIDNIEDFTASTGGVPLQVDLPADTPTGKFEWHLPQPTSDTTVTYDITYTVVGAAELGPDVAELYWDFTGDDRPRIDEFAVTVHLPGDAPNARPGTAEDDATVVRVWAHGPLNGTGTIVLGPGVVEAGVDNVGSGEFAELRILVPTTEMTGTPSGGPRLQSVLDEECTFIGELCERPKEPKPWTYTASLASIPAAGALGLLGLIGAWWKLGREPKSQTVLGDYWREPLEDPPAVVVSTLGKGTLDRSKAIAGTLVDLAQRGYLRIESDRDGKDHTFYWAGKQLGPDVTASERQLLDLVFRGQVAMKEDDLTAWARANRAAASKELSSWASLAQSEYKQRHYSAYASGKGSAVLFLVCLPLVLAGICTVLAVGGVGWFVIGGAITLYLLGMLLLANRTQAGAEANAKAEGLKRFLEDFSSLDDAPIGHLILWERYLVYAVTLGVSDELVRALAAKLPSVANDPGFATWYVGPGLHRFDGLGSVGNIGSSIASSFSPPSSSGSGGGFSGGGGGGGGGGGAGAR